MQSKINFCKVTHYTNRIKQDPGQFPCILVENVVSFLSEFFLLKYKRSYKQVITVVDAMPAMLHKI